MSKIEKIISKMRESPSDIRFKDLCSVCDYYFGKPRQKGSSHRIYKMPWMGDPRVNIQDDNGKAKIYQIRQVLRAIDRMEIQNGTEKR